MLSSFVTFAMAALAALVHSAAGMGAAAPRQQAIFNLDCFNTVQISSRKSSQSFETSNLSCASEDGYTFECTQIAKDHDVELIFNIGDFSMLEISASHVKLLDTRIATSATFTANDFSLIGDGQEHELKFLAVEPLELLSTIDITGAKISNVYIHSPGHAVLKDNEFLNLFIPTGRDVELRDVSYKNGYFEAVESVIIDLKRVRPVEGSQTKVLGKDSSKVTFYPPFVGVGDVGVSLNIINGGDISNSCAGLETLSVTTDDTGKSVSTFSLPSFFSLNGKDSFFQFELNGQGISLLGGRQCIKSVSQGQIHNFFSDSDSMTQIFADKISMAAISASQLHGLSIGLMAGELEGFDASTMVVEAAGCRPVTESSVDDIVCVARSEEFEGEDADMRLGCWSTVETPNPWESAVYISMPETQLDESARFKIVDASDVTFYGTFVDYVEKLNIQNSEKKGHVHIEQTAVGSLQTSGSLDVEINVLATSGAQVEADSLTSYFVEDSYYAFDGTFYLMDGSSPVMATSKYACEGCSEFGPTSINSVNFGGDEEIAVKVVEVSEAVFGPSASIDISSEWCGLGDVTFSLPDAEEVYVIKSIEEGAWAFAISHDEVPQVSMNSETHIITVSGATTFNIYTTNDFVSQHIFIDAPRANVHFGTEAYSFPKGLKVRSASIGAVTLDASTIDFEASEDVSIYSLKISESTGNVKAYGTANIGIKLGDKMGLRATPLDGMSSTAAVINYSGDSLSSSDGYMNPSNHQATLAKGGIDSADHVVDVSGSQVLLIALYEKQDDTWIGALIAVVVVVVVLVVGVILFIVLYKKRHDKKMAQTVPSDTSSPEGSDLSENRMLTSSDGDEERRLLDDADEKQGSSKKRRASAAGGVTGDDASSALDRDVE